jgi:hypothetical protein
LNYIGFITEKSQKYQETDKQDADRDFIDIFLSAPAPLHGMHAGVDKNIFIIYLYRE